MARLVFQAQQLELLGVDRLARPSASGLPGLVRDRAPSLDRGLAASSIGPLGRRLVVQRQASASGAGRSQAKTRSATSGDPSCSAQRLLDGRPVADQHVADLDRLAWRRAAARDRRRSPPGCPGSVLRGSLSSRPRCSNGAKAAATARSKRSRFSLPANASRNSLELLLPVPARRRRRCPSAGGGWNLLPELPGPARASVRPPSARTTRVPQRRPQLHQRLRVLHEDVADLAARRLPGRRPWPPGSACSKAHPGHDVARRHVAASGRRTAGPTRG